MKIQYMCTHIIMYMHTYIAYFLKLWPGRLFLSSNFSPWPLNKTSNYTRLAFITWSSESKFFGWWMLMDAGSTHVADRLDTVHHEMDSVVRSHHVIYICLVASNKTTHSGEGACWPIHTMPEFAVALIKNFQILDCTPLENLFTNHMALYCTKGLCHLLSSIYHITGRRWKGKGSVIPCKYNYGSTKDSGFI